MFDHLIPKPNGAVRLTDGSFLLPQAVGVRLDGFDSYCIRAFFERSNLDLRTEHAEDAEIVLSHKDTLPQEGYELDVEAKRIRIAASTERGVIWALVTLYQLMDSAMHTIPLCHIEDAPACAYRGFLMDCVRHFFPREQVCRMLDELSLVKINILHWHLSDDQAYRLESKVFPELNSCSSRGGFYSFDDVREILHYARLRGIEVIPEIDLPGHTTALTHAYPMLCCHGKSVPLAKSGGIYKNILCPGKESTYAFVEKLLGEVIPLFDSPYFHIGGDEARADNWELCPDCQKEMKSLHLSQSMNLQGEFQRRVVDMVRALGKQPIMWNDALAATNAPTGVAIQYWTAHTKNRLPMYLKSGAGLIYSYCLNLYIDYPYCVNPPEKLYNASPIIDDTRYRDVLLGYECNLWAERVPNGRVQEKRSFPRVWAMAENAWTRDSLQEYDEFLSRAKLYAREACARGVHVMPVKKWQPRGVAKKFGLLFEKIMKKYMQD